MATLEFREKGLGLVRFKVYGSWFRVYGSEFKVWSLGFSVLS
jgi:hypothetical protein